MKPKIAVIGLKGLPAFGGAATVGENIINQLKEEFDFTVYSVSSHTSKNTQNSNYKQIVFSKSIIPFLNLLLYYIKSAIHCFFVGNYDLIHLHHIDGVFVVPLLKLKYSVIVTAHGKSEKTDKWKSFSGLYYKIMNKIFFSCPDAITTVSNVHRMEYQEQTNKAVWYIPNGINIIDYERDDLVRDSYILFSAARIIEIKGLHTLLKALKIIHFTGKIIVIGDLTHRRTYSDHINRISENLNIEFIDLIKEKEILFNYIKRAQLFIFPSLVEAMSMTLLEVASLKTPTIASDIPENMSIFSEEEILFFRVGDENELADKVQWALENSEKMHDKAKLAFDHLKSSYNWVSISAEYRKLYMSFIKNRKEN